MSAPSSLGLSVPARAEEPGSRAAAPNGATPFVGVVQRRSRRRRTRWLLVLVASIFVANVLAGERGVLTWRLAGREHGSLANSLAELRWENVALREQARRLREDPRQIEAVARQELGLMRPGERLFVVKRTPPPASPCP